MGGGTIGASLPALEAWHSAFYAVLRRELGRGKFVGKDQNVMAATCLEPRLCLLVGAATGDWFMLQDWLIGNLPQIAYQRLDVRSSPSS